MYDEYGNPIFEESNVATYWTSIGMGLAWLCQHFGVEFGGNLVVQGGADYAVFNDAEAVAAMAQELAPYLDGVWGGVLTNVFGWTSVSPGVYQGTAGSLGIGETGGALGNTTGSLNTYTFGQGELDGIFDVLFENTDGSYYVDADGNEIPFSFTAAGLQALMGATSGSQAGSGASLYATEEWNEAYQDIAQALGEAGFGVDFNGDGVYDMNDINILLSIVENGPLNPEQVQIAEILNYVDGANSVDFGIDDVIMFMNFFGNPGPTTVYGYEGSSYSWIDGDGDQTVYSMDSATGYQGTAMGPNINMFGYFDDAGTWVDYDYDDLTPDDYFGPGWSATQTNNNETTS